MKKKKKCHQCFTSFLLALGERFSVNIQGNLLMEGNKDNLFDL